MPMFPKNERRFNGQTFIVTSRARVRGQAEKTAEMMRKKGWLARIVAYRVVRGGMQWYAVYVRRA